MSPLGWQSIEWRGLLATAGGWNEGEPAFSARPVSFNLREDLSSIGRACGSGSVAMNGGAFGDCLSFRDLSCNLSIALSWLQFASFCANKLHI